MIASIEWFRLLILNNPSFEYLIVFVGTLLGGEVALFFVGFLIAQSILPMYSTILISFVGAFLPNLLWFYIGKTRAVETTTRQQHANTTFLVITEAVRRVSRGSHLMALIIIKFLVGTPPILIIYTHKTAISIKKFIYYESIAIFFSVLVMMSVGYIGGRGFTYITEISKNVYSAIGFILLIVFLITVFQVYLEKAFISDKKD